MHYMMKLYALTNAVAEFLVGRDTQVLLLDILIA